MKQLGNESVSNFPKVTQIVRGRPGIQTCAHLSRSSYRLLKGVWEAKDIFQCVGRSPQELEADQGLFISIHLDSGLPKSRK